MRIPLNDLRSFSQCPAYYHYSIDSPLTLSKPKRTEIINKVIKRCYMKHTEMGQLVTWRSIMGWIDKAIFSSLDLNNEPAVEAAKKFSESIIIPVKNWYRNVYRYEEYEGFINVPLEVTKKGHQIHSIAPIIKMTDPITVVYIDDIVASSTQMYNDLNIRGLAWLAARQLNTGVVQVEHIFIGPRAALETTVLKCTREMNRRTEKIILQLADAIAAKVKYPSITSMCNTCPYRSECLL